MRDDTHDANEMFIRSQPPIKTRLEIEATKSRMEPSLLWLFLYEDDPPKLHVYHHVASFTLAPSPFTMAGNPTARDQAFTMQERTRPLSSVRLLIN